MSRLEAATKTLVRAALGWRDARDWLNAVDGDSGRDEAEWHAAMNAEREAEEALVVAADAYDRELAPKPTGKGRGR